MDKILGEALKLSKLGFSVIPITKTKQPAISFWRNFQTRPMTERECKTLFKKAYGIALLTGGNKKITAIDFDVKYFLEDDLYDRIKKSLPISLLKKMKVAKTVSGGYHWLFTCDKIEPNQKLANRPSTEEEVMKTFEEERKDGKDINQAMKVASNDRTKVLLETRGGSIDNCGGYVLIDPTPDYKWIYGSLREISVEEYDLLMDTLRSFNTYTPPVKNTELAKVDKGEEENPFADFNQRGNGLDLLLDHGWKIQSIRGNNIRLLRPGQVHSASSGLWDSNTLIFNCFSTSTNFEVGKGYTNTDLLMELENLNGPECYKKLTDLGYGIKK